MGPLRRDGFLLNAEPLAHVRSFHTIPSRPLLSLSLCPLPPRHSARPHQYANHNFYQSHLRVTIADNRYIALNAFCLPPGFSNNALEQFCHAHHCCCRWSSPIFCFICVDNITSCTMLDVARLNSSCCTLYI